MELKDAPKSVQLAVDLIYLFETNHIDPVSYTHLTLPTS